MNKNTEPKKKTKNEFYEKTAVILAALLMLFVGLSFFIKPTKEAEVKVDSVELEYNKEINLDEENVKDISVEELNKAINPPETEVRQKKPLSFAQRKKIAEFKRKKEEILRKHKANFTKRKPVNKQIAQKQNIVVQDKKQEEYIPEVEDKVESVAPVKNNIRQQEDNFEIFLDTTCSKEEIEYVLKLFSPNSSPITLIFRKERRDANNVPEIIYATLPYNRWKNVTESLDNIISSIFGEFFQEENNSDDTKTKISASFTTPCSASAYVSDGFYVSKNPPAMMNASAAKSYCQSKNGRLPDILEVMSIMRHKQIPQGYYVTSSERLEENRVTGRTNPIGDFMVMHYIGNNIYFTNTSKLSTGQMVYAECVLK